MSKPQDSNPWSKIKLLPVLFVIGLFIAVWVRSQSSPASKGTSPAPTAAVASTSVTDKGQTILRGPIFGTTYTIKVNEKLDEVAREGLQANIERRLKKIDEAMSTYKKTSEVSRFNALPLGGAVTVSKATAEVLEVALHVGQLTKGAFDVTVGPLVNAWGFGPEQGAKAPDAAKLKTLRARVGASRVMSFDEETRQLTKKVDGAALDLSAVAKGYAVDVVVKVLEEQEFTGIMVEIGGELRVSGQRADGKPWVLGIQNPRGGEPYEIFDAEEGALATSGDYRNFRVIDGKHVSHTIDPRTGAPVTHGVASVSVLTQSCTAADAWATALTVLGPVKGIQLADEHRLAVMMLVRDGDGFKRQISRLWPARSHRPGAKKPTPPKKD